MARIEVHGGADGSDPGGAAGRARYRWTLHLPPLEAAVVDSLPGRLQQLLGDPDGNRRVIDRLFPPSYSDPAEERENRRLLGGSLLAERREMLRDVKKSLRAGRGGAAGMAVRLDADGLDLWLRFINDMRLMLATELGVEENIGAQQIAPDNPDAPRFTLLIYLGGLESLLVEAAIGDPGF